MTETTKRRGPIGAEYGSPGPIYKLPPLIGDKRTADVRFTHRPEWYFGSRYNRDINGVGPGPAYGVDSKLLRYGREAGPSFSLYSRPVYLSNDATPDPGRYNYEEANKHIWKSSASFSFGGRQDRKHLDQIPAANSYQLDPMIQSTKRSTKPSAPGYSIYSRNKFGGFGEDLKKTPGPGTYGISNTNAYKKALPEVTIGGRLPIPGDNSQKPGPGAYNLKVNPGVSFSFGTHHSPYRGHLIVDGDIDD